MAKKHSVSLTTCLFLPELNAKSPYLILFPNGTYMACDTEENAQAIIDKDLRDTYGIKMDSASRQEWTIEHLWRALEWMSR